MSEYHWTHEHEATFIKCLSSAEKVIQKRSILSQESPSYLKIKHEGQTGNIYLVRYHALIRPFTNSELSVKIIKYSWLEMRNGQILSNPFTWRYRSFAETAKWTKPKASRWTRLYLKEQKSSIIHRLHTKKKHINDNIPEPRHDTLSMWISMVLFCCVTGVGCMNPAWIRNLP